MVAVTFIRFNAQTEQQVDGEDDQNTRFWKCNALFTSFPKLLKKTVKSFKICISCFQAQESVPCLQQR